MESVANEFHFEPSCVTWFMKGEGACCCFASFFYVCLLNPSNPWLVDVCWIQCYLLPSWSSPFSWDCVCLCVCAKLIEIVQSRTREASVFQCFPFFFWIFHCGFSSNGFSPFCVCVCVSPFHPWKESVFLWTHEYAYTFQGGWFGSSVNEPLLLVCGERVAWRRMIEQ